MAVLIYIYMMSLETISNAVDRARVWRVNGLTRDGIAELLTHETKHFGANGNKESPFSLLS